MPQEKGIEIMKSYKIPKAGVLRAWNLSTETLADVQKVIATVRTKLDTRTVIDTRRAVLELTATLGHVLKDMEASADFDKEIAKCISLVIKFERYLDKIKGVEGVDIDRLKVVIKRTSGIRKLLETGK